MKHKLLWLLVIYEIFNLLFFSGGRVPLVPFIAWIIVCMVWYRLPWDEPDMLYRIQCMSKGLWRIRKQTKLWHSAKDYNASLRSIIISVDKLLNAKDMAVTTSANLASGLKIIDYVHHRGKTFILICFGPPGEKKKQRKLAYFKRYKPSLGTEWR